MCGLLGYINKNNRSITDTSVVIQMLSIQKHRGPDDSGIRAFNLTTKKSAGFPSSMAQTIKEEFNSVFAFNRLSIQDLSMNGHQPMVNKDSNVILMLNGEVYNAFEYKKALESEGITFRSTTDTEVVLNLYLKYGISGLLLRLNGMFAIAIADLRLGKIYLIRDRFGIKPLYYLDNHERLAFSSEVKSFKFLNNFNFELNEDQLDEYLIFRNNVKDTILRDVKLLDPGKYIEFSVNGRIEEYSYFDVNSLNRFPRDNTFEHSAAYIEELLEKAVQSQLISDVKLGCQLSGGVDSSLITFLANKNKEKGKFESVSVIFSEKSYNEEKYIDIVSNKVDILSHKFLLDSEYYLNNIEKIAWHYEAPINHPNTVGIYYLAQQAKKYVTVLLSGEGADEVFGGYDRFYDVVYPYINKKFLSHIKHNLFPITDFYYLNPTLRAILSSAFISPSIATQLKDNFNFNNSIANRLKIYNQLSGSVFDKQVKYEIRTYLPELLLRQDKMSMAHSIENRVPFLDNYVVEGSFQIPVKHLLIRSGFKVKNTPKYLLKKIAQKHFGYDFAFRNKMGFGIPIRQFFASDTFFQYVQDHILPGIKSRGMFNYDLIHQWVLNINNISSQNLEALWVMVSFEIWARNYLSKNENCHP